MTTYQPAFLKRIERIAGQTGMRPGKVLALWEDYEVDPARNQSLDPSLDEFVIDYAPHLKPTPKTP